MLWGLELSNRFDLGVRWRWEVTGEKSGMCGVRVNWYVAARYDNPAAMALPANTPQQQ
jgi:hypothetical protein